MMENPNLIQRPILIRGSKVTFGFDKKAYERVRSGSGGRRVELSHGRGHVERDLLSQPRKRRRGFDELAFYAEHFDTVEVNSSFYRVPAIKTTEEWARRTPKDFEFSLKLFQKFTHPEMFLKATGKDPARPRSQGRGRVPRRDRSAGARPASSARCWRSFPPASRTSQARATTSSGCCTPSATIRSRWNCGTRPSATTRERRWQLLAEHGAALVQIDEPKFKTSIRQNRLPNVKTFYYMRLHGRNAAQWWKHDKSEDRYNYLYSAEELEPIVEARRRGVARREEDVPLRQQSLLGEVGRQRRDDQARSSDRSSRASIPEPFVERYPDLKGLVKILPPTPSDKLV